MSNRNPVYAPTHEELERLTDAELIECHDKVVGPNRTVVGVGYYLDELHRRSIRRDSRSMVKLTRRIVCFTVAIVLLTTVAAGAALGTLYLALTG